jgi:hypothetical protein
MAEQHDTAVSALQAKIDELTNQLNGKESVISKLTVGHAFDASEFIAEELTMTPRKARVVYGDHFDIVDDAIVAYDKPRGAKDRTQFVDGRGDPLSFDEAMRKIVEADADRDHLLRSKMKTGADSKTVKGKAPESKTAELHGIEKIRAGLAKQSGAK